MITRSLTLHFQHNTTHTHKGIDKIYIVIIESCTNDIHSEVLGVNVALVFCRA